MMHFLKDIFDFSLNSGISPVKCNTYFWFLYHKFKFIVQHIVHFAMQL